MSNTRPFLIAGGAARSGSVAAPATARVDFTKSRRVTMRASAQPVEIELRVPHLGRFQQIVPRDVVAGVRRGPRHHARQRRLGARRRLVVELARVDALDERRLLRGVGELEVRREVARDRERGRLRTGLLNEWCLPRVVAPDAEWSGVGGDGRTLGAKETLAHVPPALGELRGAERHLHAVGIREDGVVVAHAVAVIGGPAAPPGGRADLERMRLQHPIADVDHVNVLLDDDVAREHAVVDPVAEPPFGGRGVGPWRPGDVAREVVRLAAHDVADGARVNAIHQLDERGAVADLKADVERQLAFGSLADLDDAPRAGGVDGDGLLAVDMLAAVTHASGGWGWKNGGVATTIASTSCDAAICSNACGPTNSCFASSAG